MGLARRRRTGPVVSRRIAMDGVVRGMLSTA